MTQQSDDGLAYRLSEVYRDLHEHPELSLREFRTADIVANALRPLGFDVTTGVGGTGVVGAPRNGPGPVVMLRADMDALPVTEATGLPYASTARAVDSEGKEVPVAHACGHDMHSSRTPPNSASTSARSTATRGRPCPPASRPSSPRR